MRAMHHDRGHRMAVMTVGLLLTALAMPAVVAAHAELQSTSPEAGTTVDVSPDVVSATFDDDLVASRSSIRVIAPDGSTEATGGVVADDLKTLSVDVPPLGPATYQVRWAAATEDGHLERGRFEFTVAEAPSPAPTAAPTQASAAPPSTSAAPTGPPTTPSPVAVSPAPSTTPDGSESGSESLGQIAIIALAGIAIGLAIGWWRSRRAT
jgi:methionine-rich copper-binding protein CopC